MHGRAVLLERGFASTTRSVITNYVDCPSRTVAFGAPHCRLAFVCKSAEHGATVCQGRRTKGISLNMTYGGTRRLCYFANLQAPGTSQSRGACALPHCHPAHLPAPMNRGVETRQCPVAAAVSGSVWLVTGINWVTVKGQHFVEKRSLCALSDRETHKRVFPGGGGMENRPQEQGSEATGRACAGRRVFCHQGQHSQRQF